MEYLHFGNPKLNARTKEDTLHLDRVSRIEFDGDT